MRSQNQQTKDVALQLYFYILGDIAHQQTMGVKAVQSLLQVRFQDSRQRQSSHAFRIAHNRRH